MAAVNGHQANQANQANQAHRASGAPLRIGDTVHIPEPDYCYGLGTLTLRITGIGNATQRRDWIQLRGVQLDERGREIKEREILARIAAIRRGAAHR